MNVVEVSWAVLNAKTQRFECRRCGDSEEAPMGLLLTHFVDICNGFSERHFDCEDTTTAPFEANLLEHR